MFYLLWATAGYVLLLILLTYFLTYFYVPLRFLYLNRTILQGRHGCSLKAGQKRATKVVAWAMFRLFA